MKCSGATGIQIIKKWAWDQKAAGISGGNERRKETSVSFHWDLKIAIQV